MSPLIDYLHDSTLPLDLKEANRIPTKSQWFLLYDKNAFGLLSRCITPDEGRKILEEIHEGECGTYIGGRSLASEVLCVGYYWPTLRMDAIEMVKRCDKCQQISPLHHQPSTPLTTMHSPLPFATWGMDILSRFPKAMGQCKFLLVAVDYFTKSVEAEAVASITKREVRKFIWKNIITHFGVSKAMVFDNSRQFDTDKLRDYCAYYGIQTQFIVVARPQTNGQVESANK